MLGLFLLIATAFITFVERKLLSYIQNRKGPNKPTFIGFLLPMLDGLKLISKGVNLINIKFYYKYILLLILTFIFPLIIIYKIIYIIILYKKKSFFFYIMLILRLFGLVFI